MNPRPMTTDGEPARTVLVYSYKRKTRDFAGPAWSYTDSAGLYKLPGYHGGQKLWVYYQADGVECWYGADTTAATPVAITDGVTTTLDIDTKANCAPKPTAG